MSDVEFVVAQFGAGLSWAGFLTPTNLGGVNTGLTGVRTSNTVGYKSPNWGGVTFQLATGLGENVVARDDGFNVEYGGGPIYAAIGYWGIGLPLGVALAFSLDFRGAGIWVGLCAGLAVVAALLLFRWLRLTGWLASTARAEGLPRT